MRNLQRAWVSGLFVLVAGTLHAALPPRVAPPSGIDLPVETRTNLFHEVERLDQEIEFLDLRLRDRTPLRALLPDVRIYHKAVDWALRYDEFLRSNDVQLARQLLDEAFRRCAQLRDGAAPWTTATGLVVRGYVSRLDGSVQPYGLVVPAGWTADAAKSWRLDVWLHGRDNVLSELKFIADRTRSPGEFAPPDALVLHPYGRYCNAFKFAGEADVFEAMAEVERGYAIDPNRRAIRGFSMGGAGCWHLAVHHADHWAAAAPGAGFAETAKYTGAMVRVPRPHEFEQRLWNWYDAAAWAQNLYQCPTIAYSGELDKQKQAADVMTEALRDVGLNLTHILGPATEHKYEAGAKQEVARQVDEAVAVGRKVEPDEVRFVTWTLRYPRMHWVFVEGLEEHWKRASVVARRLSTGLHATTENISRISFGLPATAATGRRISIRIDGQSVEAMVMSGTDRVHLARVSGRWTQTNPMEDSGMRKRPGLQGPIDDAFMDRFLFVRPTGKPVSARAGEWVAAALARATNEWRSQFRGETPVKDDVDVTPTEIAESNLILWGDPSSNRLLAKMVSRLPLRWSASRLELGSRRYPATDSVPMFVYPNPLNPSRYVVLNSGFTFWNSGDASNAQQTPKLPDFAVVDLTTPLEQIPARGVIFAGFFDENWGW